MRAFEGVCVRVCTLFPLVQDRTLPLINPKPPEVLGLQFARVYNDNNNDNNNDNDDKKQRSFCRTVTKLTGGKKTRTRNDSITFYQQGRRKESLCWFSTVPCANPDL